jgi:hypothetical protein
VERPEIDDWYGRDSAQGIRIVIVDGVTVEKGDPKPLLRMESVNFSSGRNF